MSSEHCDSEPPPFPTLQLSLSNLSVASESPTAGPSPAITPRGDFMAKDHVIFCGILVIRPPECRTPRSPRSSRTPYEAMNLALKNPWNYVLGLHWFTVATVIVALNGVWLISYMSLKFAFSREIATMINGLFFTSYAVGNAVLGSLSTKLKRRKPFYFISSLAPLSPLYLVYCEPDAHIITVIAANVLSGFCSGIVSIEFGTVREYNDFYGCSDVAGGFVNSCGFLLGGTAMPWLMGTLMDYNWALRGGGFDEESGDRLYSVDDYDTAFLMMPIVIILNLCVTMMVKETNGQVVQWDEAKGCCTRK